MRLVILVGLLIARVWTQESPGSVVVEPSNDVNTVDNGLADTDIVLAFVIFRHGDRTPDQEELDLYPADVPNSDIFFPYGTKALTNKGKQRGFCIGNYLRKRYDGFISRLYLPDEISVRTTNFARTQMTALTALAALYPPPPAQKWNPALDWQPVPYETPDLDDDDLLYWYNCPRYLWLRNQAYDLPEIIKWVKPDQPLIAYLRENTKTNITTPEDVFYLDNLFQALHNVGLEPPKWAQEVMPRIKEMTKIEYAIQTYNSELVRLAAGVLMEEILNASSAAIAGNLEQPKLRLYSAHENNVASLMAAARVFEPHQPNYGATFSLELRKSRDNETYGITAVYSRNAGGPAEILKIAGCGDQAFCDYDTFKKLSQEVSWTFAEFKKQCPKLS